MLYDLKRWKPKPSLVGFIDWLETKDPNTNYNFLDCDQCVVLQYYASIGADGWNSEDEEWGELNLIASHHRKFGTLLRSAKERLGERR